MRDDVRVRMAREPGMIWDLDTTQYEPAVGIERVRVYADPNANAHR